MGWAQLHKAAEPKGRRAKALVNMTPDQIKLRKQLGMWTPPNDVPEETETMARYCKDGRR